MESYTMNEGMGKRNKNMLLAIAVLIVAIVVFFAVRSGSPLNQMTDRSAEDARMSMEQCAKDTAAQQEYLAKETFSQTYTFEAYPVPLPRYAGLRGLDPNSSIMAAEFRTKIDAELAKPENKAPNFAGYYSIIGVGMTGWGENYWIIDRRTGQAYEFPYQAQSLEFRQDSSLIIVNSKQSIQNILNETADTRLGIGDMPRCHYLNQQLVTDLRPFYFNWSENSLMQLAPAQAELKPAVNAFWVEYFADIDGTNQQASEPLAYFIRSVRKAVIGEMARIPHEGYSAFDMLTAVQGIEEMDFAGIKTKHGEYWIASNGGLQFTGNAPLDAVAIPTEGMGILLQNISKRLSMPISTTEEVDALLQKISITPHAAN